MDFHIEDTETEKLATEVAEMTGETREVAVHEALREKKERLDQIPAFGREGSQCSTLEFLEAKVWPLIPEAERRKPPLTKEEEEELLGYDGEGWE